MAVIKPLSKEKADASVRGLYDVMSKKFGLMPNIFGVMAHRPEALSSFASFFQLIMGGETLSDRDKELVYLATSMLNGCEYWTRAHLASAKQAGVTNEQFKDMLFYQRSKAFDEKDKATLHFVQLVTRAPSAVRENILEELRKYYDEKQIVELTLLICVANFTNRFNDGLQITPDLG
jgi:uncharacterized peroxidase-related enzyme